MVDCWLTEMKCVALISISNILIKIACALTNDFDQTRLARLRPPEYAPKKQSFKRSDFYTHFLFLFLLES